MWDEQGRGECCHGFSIIPKVIGWDFQALAESSCADSWCSLPLLCAGSEPLPEHQLQQSSDLHGSDPKHGLPRVFQAPSIPSFQALSFLYVVDKPLFLLLVHTSSALTSVRCQFRGIFCCLFLSYMAFFTSLGVLSSSF